MKHTGTVQV